MDEMKIDEIPPFPISRLSLRFSIPRKFFYLILLLIILLFIVIIIYLYYIHLDSERRNGSKTEENFKRMEPKCIHCGSGKETEGMLECQGK